jgi:HK97 family phage major capsid protein
MAITAATQTSDFSGFLNPTMAAPIFERAARASVIMQLVRQVPLGINSTTIPVVTGRPSVGWVSEAQAKPASAGALALKTITPQKLAAIMVVSAEVVRANPGNYISIMRDSLAEAFAVAFDRATMHDEGPDGSPGGGPFATYLDQTAKTQELGTTIQASGGTYGDLVAAMSQIVADVDPSGRRYRLTGWALDDVMEPALLSSVDTGGRPLYIDTPMADTIAAARPGRLVGRPSFMGEGVATFNLTDVVGYGGDFSQAAWGVIGGISYDVSTEAAVTINGTLMSLWENNLMAVRAEAEYGWLVNDTNAFVKLTNTDNDPLTSA